MPRCSFECIEFMCTKVYKHCLEIVGNQEVIGQREKRKREERERERKTPMNM